MANPEQSFLDYVQGGTPVDEVKVAQLFDKLQPIEPDFLIGDWEGGLINTNYPLPDLYHEGKWAGKRFKSTSEVHPMILYDENKKRYWAEEYGLARLREVKFRGVVSTALIYDNMPVMDSFRRLGDNMVVGAADTRMNDRTFFFTLTRISKDV